MRLRLGRPSTLRGSVALRAFALEGVLLLAAFLAIDVLLWTNSKADLEAAAQAELSWLAGFVREHQVGGPDYLLEEAREHLGSRSGVLLELGEGGEVLYRSDGAGEHDLGRQAGPVFTGREEPFWVASRGLGSFRLAAGVPASGPLRTRRQLRAVMAACLLAGLVAAALVARSLADTATGPLAAVAGAAERIRDTNLSARLEPLRRDYEEVARVRDAFNGMLDRLEAAVLQLRQFTADASHELRTPLSVLKVQGQSALASDRLEPAAAGLVRSQLEEIDRLTLMVEDLLTLSRLDAGVVERQALDLADLVLEGVERFRSVAEAKGVALTVAGVVPCVLAGDRAQLRRVVSNLLDNALKYTEAPGRVTVNLERRGGAIRLEVADEGRGIPLSEIPRIFERFYRADPSRSRRTGGAGLGLAIVERITASHGGAVTVASEPGKGATFAVELPSSETALPHPAERMSTRGENT
jgi:heavy metal sensor kinase